MTDNISKLKALSIPAEEDWLKIADELEENESWLEKSAKIAVAVLSYLKENNMTKQQLAMTMGVSPQYISRIVKGGENLSLETICKLEKALGVSLVEVKTPKTYSWEGLYVSKAEIRDVFYSFDVRKADNGSVSSSIVKAS